ncbi:MAG: hypothetical protein ACYDAO_01205 [Thermoplasmataceae archaeon]
MSVNKKAIIFPLLAILFLVFIPYGSNASSPNISPPPSSLPVQIYYTNNTHYTIDSYDWNQILSGVLDNTSIVSYPWANNLTQALVFFDITYTGVNAFGLEFLIAMAKEGGSPSIANATIAFKSIENLPSKVSGYSNIGALDVGAYPGFSWSKPVNKPAILQDEYFITLIAIIGSVFVMYFVFNRRK